MTGRPSPRGAAAKALRCRGQLATVQAARGNSAAHSSLDGAEGEGTSVTELIVPAKLVSLISWRPWPQQALQGLHKKAQPHRYATPAIVH